MSTARKIVVVGSGPAAVFAALAAKKQDPSADVVLVSGEHAEPYEKPPLSKAVLTGKARPWDAPIAGPNGLASFGITVRRGLWADRIDTARREVELNPGGHTKMLERIPYDALVLATGARERHLPALKANSGPIFYLRNEIQASNIRDLLAASITHVVIVGGGLIGLEVAASAAEMGKDVTVVELAPRILARVCDEETAAFVAAEHRARGVKILTGVAVTGVTDGPRPGRMTLATSTGEILPAQVVVVGVGVVPETMLAEMTGLTIDDGIVVDATCRTSDPHIFAAGDCTRFPGPRGDVRLENWRHAQDHGAIAGRNAAGAADEYRAVPSWWSEQYDLYIQGVGWPDPDRDATVSRPLPGKGLLRMDVKDGLLCHALGINAQRDLAGVRRLIERRVPVDAAALADPAQPFNAMLKKQG